MKGEVEIRYEGQHGNGLFVLKPGAFCRIPPGVRHEISNPSKTDETVFLLVQASQEDFDYVPVPFARLRRRCRSRRGPDPGPCSRRATCVILRDNIPFPGQFIGFVGLLPVPIRNRRLDPAKFVRGVQFMVGVAPATDVFPWIIIPNPIIAAVSGSVRLNPAARRPLSQLPKIQSP